MVSEAPAWSGTVRLVRRAELLAERSVGFCAGPGSEPCTPQTRFQAGSISKLVLAVVVLALTERGELQLNRPISRWLDDAPADWKPITMHQLLSHTSGLGHWGDIPGLPAMLSDPPGLDDLLAMLSDAPLMNPPGKVWRYSGPGFLVAALAVEAAAQTAYGALAADLVFRPAAMTSTTAGEFPIGRPHVASGHQHGHPIAVREGFTYLPGTGDMWTTTADLIRLNQALRSGQVIGTSTAEQLWTAHAEIAAAGADIGERPIVTEAYGYGTFLGRIAGQTARINPGDNPGYQSLLSYLPGRETDLAVLCNEDAPSVNAALHDLPLLGANDFR